MNPPPQKNKEFISGSVCLCGIITSCDVGSFGVLAVISTLESGVWAFWSFQLPSCSHLKNGIYLDIP